MINELIKEIGQSGAELRTKMEQRLRDMKTMMLSDLL